MALTPTTVSLDRMQRGQVYFEPRGTATPQMQLHWQRTMEAIEKAFVDLSGTIEIVLANQDELALAQAALETTQATLAAAIADITTAQSDITTLQSDLTNVVLKNQTAAWADPTGTFLRTTFATYPGQTVSATPTQAEVQAIDNAVKGLSQRLGALIADLRAIDALT